MQKKIGRIENAFFDLLKYAKKNEKSRFSRLASVEIQNSVR